VRTINKVSTYATQVRTKADPYQLCRCRAAPAVGLVRDPAAAATAVALVRGPAASAAAIARIRGPATAAVAADAVAWRSHQRSRWHSQRHSHGRPGSTRLRPPIDCCVRAPPRSGNTRAPAARVSAPMPLRLSSHPFGRTRSGRKRSCTLSGRRYRPPLSRWSRSSGSVCGLRGHHRGVHPAQREQQQRKLQQRE